MLPEHSGAKRIEVRLDYDEESIRLSVRDDGSGFDPTAMTALADHFGLSGMRERAEKMAGRLSINSAPGKGTEIEVHVPQLEFPTPVEA